MTAVLMWVREVAGWVLVGVGVGAFALCYFQFLLSGRVVEAVVWGFAALTLFRGGMALLKLAVASRAARDVKREVAAQAAPVRQVRPPSGAKEPAGRPRRSVLPGPGRN